MTVPLLDATFLGNTMLEWGVAVATLALGVGVLRALLRALSSRLDREGNPPVVRFIGSLVGAARALLVVALSLSAAASTLTLAPRPAAFLAFATVAILLVQAGLWASKLVSFTLDRWVVSEGRTDPASATVVTILHFVGRVLVWVVVLLLVLDNAGVDITALVAGLGVGGIAVALAVQNVLGDLFASLSIVLDRPFVVGDFIKIGDLMGTVERVGLKSTRLKSLTGEQLVLANSDMLSSRIQNYQKLQERRIQFGFGVMYETTAAQLRAVPDLVREIVAAEAEARLDRVHFVRFGDSSLDFEVVYFVTRPDYNLYMDVQQRINLGLVERLGALGVGFAYPTRTVHLQLPQFPQFPQDGAN